MNLKDNFSTHYQKISNKLQQQAERLDESNQHWRTLVACYIIRIVTASNNLNVQIEETKVNSKPSGYLWQEDIKHC